MPLYLCSMHVKAHCHPQKACLPTIYAPTREIVSSAYLRAQLQIRGLLSATNVFNLFEAQKVVHSCKEEVQCTPYSVLSLCMNKNSLFLNSSIHYIAPSSLTCLLTILSSYQNCKKCHKTRQQEQFTCYLLNKTYFNR